MSTKTAVLIPCYNEEQAIADVVRQARKALPFADIYVYDNNSTDKTAQAAANAGAVVRSVTEQGKGCVVRRMFADIDADVYVMTDGDMTYDIAAAPRLIDVLIRKQKDMVIGTRREQEKEAYRFGHRFGNMFLTFLVRTLFGIKQTDMLSGLRVFSKRFVKTFPARSNGFEIETELNVFTAMNALPFAEEETDYFSRPEGSASKLSTLKDGFKILFMILRLFRQERPLFYFSVLAAVFAGISIKTDLGISLFCLIVSLICIMIGLLMNEQLKTRREARRLAYMTYPFPDKYP